MVKCACVEVIGAPCVEVIEAPCVEATVVIEVVCVGMKGMA